MLKKILKYFLFAVLACYAFFAFILVPSLEDRQICKGVLVNITDNGLEAINRENVMDFLKDENLDPSGMGMEKFECRGMEKFINDISLVKECQVYKSTKGYVNIDIECRIPVLIVYNKEGENYSIDGDGNMIHGIQKAIRLPMVTGNVNSNMANNELKEIARAIHGNRFWEAQIEQIHFNEKGYVIMVPRVGDHIIELGKAEQVEEKLEKLYTFYKQGMNNVGWNKYSKVNIEFNDKVICTRKEK